MVTLTQTKPMKRFVCATETADVEEDVDAIKTFFIIVFTIMAFSFVPAGWIMFVVREKDTKCKHQQVRRGRDLRVDGVYSLSELTGAGIKIGEGTNNSSRSPDPKRQQ